MGPVNPDGNTPAALNNSIPHEMNASERVLSNEMPSQSIGKELREQTSSEDLSDSDDADVEDNDNYVDVENDAVEIRVVSLFDEKVFDDVPSMLGLRSIVLQF